MGHTTVRTNLSSILIIIYKLPNFDKHDNKDYDRAQCTEYHFDTQYHLTLYSKSTKFRVIGLNFYANHSLVKTSPWMADG